MATSGTTSFNLDMGDLIEEAFERCGSQSRSGYDFRTAQRSFNMLTIEWANRGINLWTIEQGQIPININAGQISYPIPVDTIDLYDHVIRQGSGQNQIDINITRISASDYLDLPTKNAYGRPIQVWIDRQSGNVDSTPVTTVASGYPIASTDTTINVTSTANMRSQGYINIDGETILYQNLGTAVNGQANQLLNCYRGMNGTTAASHSAGALVYNNYLPNINIWPTGVPGTQYQFIYWRMRRIQDSGTGVNTEDIPFRFIPCMAAGLAYYLAMKLPNIDMNRVPMLKADYEQQFQLAADEDREKASWRMVPRNLFYSR
jgi:hypothetical protein